MRAIKFRAWNGSEMIMPRDRSYYQHYMSFCGNIIQKSSEVMDCFGGGDKWRVVNDFQLMQFTGLLDKNGVEIYEGDVVLLNDHFISAVEFADCSFVVKTKSIYANRGVDVYAPSEYETVEVIGNIHETPELLK